MTKKNPLIELFEEITWNVPASRREGITIIITHRGARNNIKTIQIPEIARFDKGYIYVKKQDGEKGMDYEDEIPVPLHRVLQVIDKEGTVLYEKFKQEKKGD